MIYYQLDRKATMAAGVIPGAFTVIREYADIATGAQIGAGVYIGPFVKIGEHADIGPHAVILASVPAGAVVGAGVVWDEESAQGARDVLSADIPPPAHRGRPRKAVQG